MRSGRRFGTPLPKRDRCTNQFQSAYLIRGGKKPEAEFDLNHDAPLPSERSELRTFYTVSLDLGPRIPQPDCPVEHQSLQR